LSELHRQRVGDDVRNLTARPIGQARNAQLAKWQACELELPRERSAGVPRFYFHLFNGRGQVSDEEGQVHADLAAARSQAVREIRSLIAEDVKQGKVDLQGRIEIFGDADEPLGVVLFTDAVDFVGGATRQ